MSDRPIIRAQGLGKKYTIRHEERERYTALRDVIAEQARLVRNALWTRPKRPRPLDEDFWALRDVSFEINQGDVVGIVGRNGAGKSTLLKILSRITEPTDGHVELRGRVSSLLEVGTGFHPELTGRENIFLNGAILGMTHAEVRRKFDDIVDFAGVERFLDTPIKRYSSGMYVRLAFAVAAHLEPEILIVDEVLAVGDQDFQQKCIGRMKEVSASGRTILFVSHNLGALLATCTSGLLLESGQIAARGSMESIAQAYRASSFVAGALNTRAFYGALRTVEYDEILLNGLRAENYAAVSPGDALSFVIRGRCRSAIDDYQLYFAIFRDDVRIFTVHHEPAPLHPGAFENRVEIPARFLRPGVYSVAFGAAREAQGDWSWGADLLRIEVGEDWSEDYHRYDDGLINLPGQNCWLIPQTTADDDN